MTKLQKTFVTPEISGSFRTTLKELTLFANSEIKLTSDWVGRKLELQHLIVEIQDFNPDLIITSNKILVEQIMSSLVQSKILIIPVNRPFFESFFISQIFSIKSFLKSSHSKFCL